MTTIEYVKMYEPYNASPVWRCRIKFEDEDNKAAVFYATGVGISKDEAFHRLKNGFVELMDKANIESTERDMTNP